MVLYGLQPSTPIRNLDLWLPRLTVTLTAAAWVLTARGEGAVWRNNLAAAVVLAGSILLVGLTRFLSPTGLLTATRPPQFGQVLLAVGITGILIGGLAWLRRPRAWVAALLIILGLFVVLKTPTLAEAASGLLRRGMAQDPSLARAFDIRWLGFSYVAFRLIHTLRDRQGGRLPPVSLKEYATYVLFFPTLPAGPIDRLERFVGDLRCPPDDRLEDFLEGGRRFVLGLAKKFILADSLALFALSPTNAHQVGSGWWMWVLVYAYALQIFLDFSGYTDIAIGFGRWLGIRLPENFNQPYLKPNLTQFWNNWHMTLTQWFRGYYFNPLTRSMRRGPRPWPVWMVILFGQTTTMVLIGLWHGVTINFVVWGLWHGLGQFVQNRWSDRVKTRYAERLSRPWVQAGLFWTGVFLTFHFVALGWVWFSMPDLATSGRVFRLLFGLD
jgi:D-alanyl-lipoteichoic acid acyltransferase DltB (MBOAT superfamily)